MPAVQLALFGAIGAIAPNIVLIYSKHIVMPELTFEFWQYVVVILLYLGLAAIVAAIFPYPPPKTAWKAFVVGVALPLVISGAASVAPNTRIQTLGPGPQQPGTIQDFLSFR